MTARVRVVVVDYGGGDLTLECLRSLVATDWPADALEVVLVDNASPDPLTDRVAAELPSVRVIPSAENRGFGAGCNLALHDLDGVDHVALVNNDVVVPPGWLRPLVAALAADARLGAACPKILFRDRYREIVVDAPVRHRRLDRRPLGVWVGGVRGGSSGGSSGGARDIGPRVRFATGFWGPEYGSGGLVGQWTGNGGPGRLLVPVGGGGDDDAEVLLAADEPVPVTLATTAASVEVVATGTPTWHPLPPGGDALDVIQNVGNERRADGYGADRGYLEPDTGQYDEPADVFAWCGAAVLVPVAYLRDVGLFDESLFLYYEDFELAWRGRRRGWRYRTVPESVVRHVHSASTSADALRTAELNERNHLLVLARHGTRGEVARAVWHHARATASYARRDLVAPLTRGERPNPATVAMRVRALAGVVTHRVR